jgi:hypothetical protein
MVIISIMNEFDIKAAEWDKNPMHWDRSEVISNQIKNLIPLSKQMTALKTRLPKYKSP